MKPRKNFQIFLVSGIMALLTLVALIFFAGGYWENTPGLSYISGHQRFKSLVSSAIPECVDSLRGGYTGFPKGQIRTYFHFDPKHPDCQFADKWKDIARGDLEEMKLMAPTVPWTRILKKPGTVQVFLFLDDQSGEALLYVP